MKDLENKSIIVTGASLLPKTKSFSLIFKTEFSAVFALKLIKNKIVNVKILLYIIII